MLKLVNSSEVEDIVCDKVKPEEVDNILNNLVPQFVEMIKSLTTEKTECLGIAAIQVGINKKFFVLAEGEKGNRIYNTYFNGYYFNNGSSITKSTEGCYSYNLGKNPNTVRRWKGIHLFHDEWDLVAKTFKEKQKKRFTGLMSFAVQHEVDHHGNGEGRKSVTIFTK